MNLDPINDPDNEDLSEVECCRHCRELIEPGTEVEFNGWSFHANCLPMSVVEGRMYALAADERRDAS